MKKTLEDFIGGTPLVRLQRLPGADIAKNKTVILAKLEGNNPAGSVKDRPAISMVRRAEERYAARYRQPRVNPERVAIRIEVDRFLVSSGLL